MVIVGHFIFCGSPIFDKEHNIIDWDATAIKISDIKKIQVSNLSKERKQSILYLDKNDWYLCDISLMDLLKELNKIKLLKDDIKYEGNESQI